MMRLRLILVGCFLLTLAAGGAAGFLLARHMPRPADDRSEFARRLDLTPAQQEQVEKIWSALRGAPGQGRDQRSALSRQRDEKVLALLTEEQKSQYERILEEHAAARERLSADRQKAYEEARRKTRELLSPDQAARYDKLLEEQSQRHEARRARRESATRPDSQPSSRPATQPAPHVEE